MRDHSQPGDPYGITAVYTSQAFLEDSGSPMRDPNLDMRGNALCAPRGIPTQAEADAIKAEG